MMIHPPSLQPGDQVGITCPAGAVRIEEMQSMFDQLIAWGYRPVIGKTVGSAHYKFSATDDERLADLQDMLDNPDIKAILFGRGGYGVVRIIDRIDFTQFARQPKWLVGYSDITCLHSHVNAKFSIVTLHAHMGAGYRPENRDEYATQSIQTILCGEKTAYHLTGSELNRTGRGRGRLCGGNLALLSDLTGTPSDIDTRGCILVIEDIGEYKYNIDRMLWQLLRSGKFDHLTGLLVGGFTDTQDNEIPFGMTLHEMIAEKVRHFNYPVCYDFPVGHQPLNYPLKMGAEMTLTIDADGMVSLTE